MQIEDILTLAKAGFNAGQIAALTRIQTPAPTPSPSPATATGTGTVPGTDAGAGILKQLQLLGINTSQQPKQETVEDVLASIINPPTQKEGGK